MVERSKVQIHNSKTVFPRKDYSGLNINELNIVNGARIVFTLYVYSKDPSAVVTATVKTSFSEHMPFYEVLTLAGSPGVPIKGVLSDFHNLIDIELDVVGGSAEVIMGLNVFDNALTTRIDNAEIQVDLNDKVQPNGTYDSVRVGNGKYELNVNPDGSINTNIVNTSVVPEEIKTIYSSITAVPKDIQTLLGTYVAPVGKKSYLQRVSVSGSNYAEFILKLNSTNVMKKRTWASGGLNAEFNFDAYSENGKELLPGETLETFVEHARPFIGDFEITYQILEIG